MGDSVGRSHEIVLLGKTYKLKSTHDDEYLSGLAEFVTAQVTEVQRRGSVSTLDAALLAALNIADEYHRLKREAEERLTMIGEKAQALVAGFDEQLERGEPSGIAPDDGLPDGEASDLPVRPVGPGSVTESAGTDGQEPRKADGRR